ncbi:MAG: cysteine desulfurase, partial [Candidatus Dadabacteria bacterium]
LQPGDEIIVSEMEHHSNIVPWQLACERTGAVLRVIPVTDDGQLDLEAFQRLLNERTRLVSVAHVSNALGTINPVRQVVELADAAGVPTLLDGAQAVPHQAVDVRDLGCTFYAFSGHKLFGPTGVGVLYGQREWLDRLPPWQGGGDMIREVRFPGTTFNEPPHKFEAGTPHIAGVIGLGAAIDYVEALGYDWIQAREQELLAYGTAALEPIPGLRLIGTAPNKAAVLSFVIDGLHPHDISTILDQEGVAVRAGHHCTQPLMERFGVPATTRASMAFYNTTAELDQLADALRKAVRLLGV